jgi:hypothetical protein
MLLCFCQKIVLTWNINSASVCIQGFVCCHPAWIATACFHAICNGVFVALNYHTMQCQSSSP